MQFGKVLCSQARPAPINHDMLVPKEEHRVWVGLNCATLLC